MAAELLRRRDVQLNAARPAAPIGHRSGMVTVIPCTSRQLEVFVAAAEDCHFIRTASRLGISQAAVSSHIAALERQIGTQLFLRRRGRRPILSSYGMRLLSETHWSIEAIDGNSSFVRSENRRRIRVRIGADGHLLDEYIRPQLPRFYQQHSDLDLECLYVDSADRCAELISERNIDLMVCTVPNPAQFPLHAEILRPDRLSLYVSTTHASSRPLSPVELSDLPFILPPEGSPACRLVQFALLDAGVGCHRIAAYVQFARVAKDLAKRGEGIVALFETMISRKDARDLIGLDFELPTMYRTLFRAKETPAPALLSVENFLRSALAH